MSSIFIFCSYRSYENNLYKTFFVAVPSTIEALSPNFLLSNLSFLLTSMFTTRYRWESLLLQFKFCRSLPHNLPQAYRPSFHLLKSWPNDHFFSHKVWFHLTRHHLSLFQNRFSESKNAINNRWLLIEMLYSPIVMAVNHSCILLKWSVNQIIPIFKEKTHLLTK